MKSHVGLAAQEHTRRSWAGMPLARDIPLKLFPDQEHGNPMHGE